MESNFFDKLQWGKPANKFSRKNIVQLVKGGAPFFAQLQQLIAKAEYSLHLQTYIFAADSTGQAVAGWLMEAAKKGVAVCLMADGYASRGLPKEFIQQMESAGVKLRFFEPLFRGDDFYFGRRLHHKVVVADARYAVVSGSNIADRYNDMPGQPAWYDMGLWVEGDSVLELFDICTKIWQRDRSKRNLLRKKLLDVFNYISANDAVGVRVLQNDWVRRKLEIYLVYHKLFKQSKRSITIVCSYFLPGLSLRRRLSSAVQRGVDVKVILASTSDVALTKHAERYLYKWMLRNGIQVYEYLPSVLHAKAAVVDDEFLMLGSYNINDLSAQASVELNLLVKDGELAQELKAEVNDIIATKCVRIDAANYSLRLLSLRQLWQFVCYHALRFVLTIGTFYFKQEE